MVLKAVPDTEEKKTKVCRLCRFVFPSWKMLKVPFEEFNDVVHFCEECERKILDAIIKRAEERL